MDERGISMYEIRRITPAEVDDAIKLSEYCFVYRLEGDRRVERARFMENHTIFGAFTRGQMIAKTHIIPLSVVVDAKEYSMGGIASVATYPEHRRNGVVNGLLETALNTMRESKQVLSYLHPFDIDFYRRYGYELVSNLKKLTITKADIYHYKGVSGYVERTNGQEHIAEANSIYHRYCEKYNGMLKRSSKWWQDTRSRDYTLAIYYSQNNDPLGYVFYRISEGVLQIREYIYLDESSRRGLWNFIANHDSMVKSIEITIIEQDQMSFLFKNPAVKIEIIPDFMGRVVLVKEFLEQYIGVVPTGIELALSIEDHKAPWNTGTYTITASSIKYDSRLTRDNALHMDIGAFTALVLGSHTPEFLYETKRISGNRDMIDALNQILTTRKSAFLDYF